MSVAATGPMAEGVRVPREGLVMRLGVTLLVAWLLLTIALPLWALLSKSFQNADGAFVGLANYLRYFSTPALFGSVFNSIAVALASTAIVIPLAFGYAYALTRSRMPFKGLLYAVARRSRGWRPAWPPAHPRASRSSPTRRARAQPARSPARGCPRRT